MHKNKKLERHICPLHQKRKFKGLGGFPCECFYRLSEEDGDGWKTINMTKKQFLQRAKERKERYFGSSG